MQANFLIHSPITRFAQERPSHPALAFRGAELSYAELDTASNRLANALLANGLQPGGRVGIYMHKSLQLGVAIYGVLKAGGVFVPLDPFIPVERLKFIVDDCDIEHVVSADELAANLQALTAEHSCRIYGVAADTGAKVSLAWDDIDAYADSSPDAWIIDQDLAYIMYTSGSTGQPKGMMHTHHGSISYARWGAQHVALTHEDRVASHAPLHFDLSIFDFFSTSQSGATVVLVPESVTKFAASWSQYIDDERISVVFTVPFTLIEMLQRGAMEQRDLSSLRWILYGGEPFPPKHLRTLMAELPAVRFTNVYGPAEAPSCTCYDIPQDEELGDEPIPIGTVSVNSEDLIVNADEQECGIGEAGELCIRSSTLTKGYWNRPDLNDKVYLYRDSYGPFPDVFFRTGDMVERHADGLLRFLGRKDRMVKTRGNRVELDEVEAAFASHAAVAEAAAYVVPDATGSKAIMAAVKFSDEAEATVAALTQHAKTFLPSYALPQELVIVDEFPRTTSGKIDRRLLAENTEQLSKT